MWWDNGLKETGDSDSDPRPTVTLDMQDAPNDRFTEGKSILGQRMEEHPLCLPTNYNSNRVALLRSLLCWFFACEIFISLYFGYIDHPIAYEYLRKAGKRDGKKYRALLHRLTGN